MQYNIGASLFPSKPVWNVFLHVKLCTDAICLLQESCTISVMAAISSSNTAFALELFRTLSKEKPDGNIFVSPLSISSALAMVYLGAKGDTAAQMAQVSTLSVYYMRFLHHMTSLLNL